MTSNCLIGNDEKIGILFHLLIMLNVTCIDFFISLSKRLIG